jgi:hypothetical protein
VISRRISIPIQNEEDDLLAPPPRFPALTRSPASDGGLSWDEEDEDEDDDREPKAEDDDETEEGYSE